jgi:hypothetical protein
MIFALVVWATRVAGAEIAEKQLYNHGKHHESDKDVARKLMIRHEEHGSRGTMYRH